MSRKAFCHENFVISWKKINFGLGFMETSSGAFWRQEAKIDGKGYAFYLET